MFEPEADLWPRGDVPNPDLCGEDDRLSVMGAFGLETLDYDEELDRIARFAARLCNTPIALVSLVEKDRQRFLAKTGLVAESTPRPTSFCAHAMLDGAPMVVADATQDDRFVDNPLVVGEPNIRFYAGAPLISNEGAPLGSLCVIDTEPRPEGLDELQSEGLALLAEGVMRRLEARRAAMANEEKFTLLADNIPDMAWSCDADGHYDYFNRRWGEFTGDVGPATAEDWRPLIHPDDQDDAFGRWDKAGADKAAFESEYRMRRHDGEWRWVMSRALPMVDEHGEVTRWFGTITDIDETRDLSDARDLLARELSHRIKNIFAVVSGLVAIKVREHPEADVFAKDISSTIKALGVAHDYVRPVEGRQGERLQELLGDLLAPYHNGIGDRVVIEGDDSAIAQRAATPLALVFHELATNSAKYGALSCKEGRIVISLKRADGEMRIVWQEHSEPCEDASTDGEGFGSRMLRMAIEGQMSGRLERRFTEAGLQAEIVIPLKRLAQ